MIGKREGIEAFANVPPMDLVVTACDEAGTNHITQLLDASAHQATKSGNFTDVLFSLLNYTQRKRILFLHHYLNLGVFRLCAVDREPSSRKPQESLSVL